MFVFFRRILLTTKKKYFLKGLEIIGIIFCDLHEQKENIIIHIKTGKLFFQNTAMLCLSKIPLGHKSKKKGESIFSPPQQAYITLVY
jgi:hypothetical protein